MSAEHRPAWCVGIPAALALAVLAALSPLLCIASDNNSSAAGVLPYDNASAPCSILTQADSPLSLARAADLALCHNSQIRASWAVIREQAAAVGEAKAAYWPAVSLTAAELNDRTSYPSSSLPASNRTGDFVYGSFVWRLFDFGGRGANRRTAQARLEAAIASRDATVQRILAQVVQGYFDTMTAVALLADKRADESSARETLASAQRRVEGGQAAQSDVLQSTTALAKSRLESHRAQALYDKAQATLVYTLGLPVDTPLQLAESLNGAEGNDEEDLKAWLEETQRHHPAITAARAALDAAQDQVTAARSTGLPTLDLTANYYQNGFPNQGLATINSRTVTFGLSVSVPLFDGWAAHYKVEAARALVKEKEAELDDTVQSTLMAVIAAHAAAQSALQNLGASEDLLRAARQAFESSQRRYLSGAGDIVELLVTQSARADAEQQRIQCLAEWHAARLILLASAGRLDREAISQ